MKKLIYAAGVLSLGGASLAVQAAEGDSKPWTVSLTTQGCYDSNINTQPDGDGKIGSWGIYVSPSVDYTKVWDASTRTLGASYGANYFFETVLWFGWATFALDLAAPSDGDPLRRDCCVRLPTIGKTPSNR